MKRSVRQIADAVGARLIGDGDAAIHGVSSLQAATPNDLVFVEDEKHLAAALESRAGAIVAGEFAAKIASSRPLLICDHPKLAFARALSALQEFSKTENAEPFVHKTAAISASAVLAPGVRVEENAVIGDGARLGRTRALALAVRLARTCVVGKDCDIYPNVTIYPGTTPGIARLCMQARCWAAMVSDMFAIVRPDITKNFRRSGRLVIEDDVEIGANATIDRGALDETRIRRGTKIDNLVHIGHNCEIGEDVVIAAQTGLVRQHRDREWRRARRTSWHRRTCADRRRRHAGRTGWRLPNKVLRGKGVGVLGNSQPAQRRWPLTKKVR